MLYTLSGFTQFLAYGHITLPIGFFTWRMNETPLVNSGAVLWPEIQCGLTGLPNIKTSFGDEVLEVSL